MLHGYGPTIQTLWCVAILRLASHMTALKLQSDWDAQIPFPGPRIVSKFIRPLSSQKVGSGHETIYTNLLSYLSFLSWAWWVWLPPRWWTLCDDDRPYSLWWCEEWEWGCECEECLEDEDTVAGVEAVFRALLAEPASGVVSVFALYSSGKMFQCLNVLIDNEHSLAPRSLIISEEVTTSNLAFTSIRTFAHQNVHKI